jgi:hypothetical protein
MRFSPRLVDWISREGWRGRRRIDVAADLRARDESQVRNISGPGGGTQLPGS